MPLRTVLGTPPLPLTATGGSLRRSKAPTGVLHRVTFVDYTLSAMACQVMLFIRIGGRKLLPGAGQGEGGDIIAAVEAGQFPFPAFLIQLQNLGIGSAAAILLGDQVMIIGHGGDLGQVGDAHDLLAQGDGE